VILQLTYNIISLFGLAYMAERWSSKGALNFTLKTLWIAATAFGAVMVAIALVKLGVA